MIVSNSFQENLAVSVQTEPTMLGGGVTMKMHLVGVPFTPSPETLVADMPPPVFTGATAIACAATPPKEIRDPQTGNIGWMLAEPIGGFNWECTVAPAAPVLVYGVYLGVDGDPSPLGCMAFADGPKTIANVGDFIEASAVFGFMLNPPVV